MVIGSPKIHKIFYNFFAKLRCNRNISIFYKSNPCLFGRFFWEYIWSK